MTTIKFGNKNSLTFHIIAYKFPCPQECKMICNVTFILFLNIIIVMVTNT